MDLKRLDTLKKRLIDATDFESVFGYFLDHFGEDEAFLKFGERTESPPLEAFVSAIGRQLLGTNAVVLQFLFIRVPGHPFIHGAGRINGRVANVLYFEDIQVGLVGLLPAEPDGMTNFARFSGRQLPPGYIGSEN